MAVPENKEVANIENEAYIKIEFNICLVFLLDLIFVYCFQVIYFCPGIH